MPSCDRFEREGLVQLERGMPMAPHFVFCYACRESRAAYARLGAALRGSALRIRPPAGWRRRVWARIARRVARRRA